MIIAKLYKWDGEEVVQQIERDWIEDITSAVESQTLVVNVKEKFTIDGKQFRKVEVFEID